MSPLLGARRDLMLGQLDLGGARVDDDDGCKNALLLVMGAEEEHP
jgi:hypothetical protein